MKTRLRSDPMENKSKIILDEWKGRFGDRLILPEEAGYDQARALFYGGMDRRPLAIIRPANTSEVADIIGLARATGLELAVRSGGHSVAGKSVVDGGIVLDLANMKAMQMDIDGRTAWAESGLTSGEYSAAAGAQGLVTGFGDTGSVGLGGLTLGGGVGYLVRKYGLTIDSLLAAKVVTADGELHYVDEKSEPDLFWAIRGGGGNFGVATSFQFRLEEVAWVMGGLLILPARAEVITAFIQEAEEAPDELSTIATVMVAPPMPFLPKEAHGKLIVMAMLVYAGAPESGEAVVGRFRKITKPLADMVKPMRYPEIYQGEQAGFHPVAAARTMFIERVDGNVAGTILEYVQASKAFLPAAQLRVLGGAMGRIPAEKTAFAHRQSRIMANVAALYQNPDEKAEHESWASHFAAALRQKDGGAYVNFLGDEGEERIRAAYPGATWERLAAIKRRYDPDNFFHLNQNISPKG